MADEAPKVEISPWVMTRTIDGSGSDTQVHLMMSAARPRLLRICYTNGPEDSHINASSVTKGGNLATTRIYKGGCANVGGTDIYINHGNQASVSGSYAVLDTDELPAKPAPPAGGG